MRRAGAFILILLLGFSALIAAQEDPSIETDWDDFSYDIFARGDQTFLVNFGLVFPTVFINQGENIGTAGWNTVGGTGSLIFNYYLTSYLFVGAEAAVMFISTVGKSTVFMIPIGARIGTQFIYDRFEFPIAATIGVVWQNFLTFSHFGLNFKLSGSALYRATNQWAFGLTTCWYFMPQWTGTPAQNVMGNFMDITLTARYHF
jgi:hypothetical protein